jgi:hypothetical protein
LIPKGERQNGGDGFEDDLSKGLTALQEFRTWVDGVRKKNIRFIRAYEERLEREVEPFIRELKDKYENRDEGKSIPFHHLMEGFSWLQRPTTMFETGLRPSVGMGVFLERWMMVQAFEEYLKECCEKTDYHLARIIHDPAEKPG